MKYVAIFWIVVIAILQGGQRLAHGGGFTLDEVGRWSIPIGHKNIEAVLESMDYSQGKLVSLRFNATETVRLDSKEEVSLAERVMEIISRSNFEPNRINKITIPLQNTNYERSITSQIVDSKIVDACLERKYCYQAQFVANKHLKSIKAFNNISRVLLRYGLVIKSVTIEDVAVSLRPSAGGREAYQAAAKDTVHCGGIVVIETVKAKEI